ncbi:hypothetical protein ACIPSE_45105 [Streptomyces sp. NPDC090106]|uniref:hypothetical protein n=1 Tax=Streptomyces sp. NPDC090106 TaxID=3365946 RepID=UPI0037FA0C89
MTTSRRIGAQLAAAAHHLVTSRVVLVGLAILATLALGAGHRTAFAVIAAVFTDSRRPLYATCPLCACWRRGRRKERTK